ncbi:MAG: hypothetical protein ISP33_07150 [Ilumatobacteraceae bacterium]|nr:hypothetical protein [Ilumatobacteraceae bacterium]
MNNHWRRVAAGAAVLALVAGACGGGDDDAEPAPAPAEESAEEPAEEPAEETAEEPAEETPETTLVDVTIAPEVNVDPVFGGTLRFGLEADVDGLNPTQNNISASGYAMLNAIFDPLAIYDENGVAVPFLAESFTPNEDFTQWTVTLREGVTFHDGEVLNADAVAANFASLRASALPALAINPFFPPLADDGTDPGLIIIDDLTVQFNPLDSSAYFPAYLTGQLGMMASPAWLAASAEDPTLNQQPVGTGPFKYESRSEDSVTKVVRNEDWWGGDVYLDAIEFAPVTDATTRLDLLLNGELEGLHTTNLPDIEVMSETEGITQVIDETGEESFAMINSQVPPFNDIRARQALTLATDREGYQVLINEDLSTQANGRFVADNPYYNPDVVQAGDDVAAAQALVAEYCAELGDETNPLTGGSTCTDGRINMEFQWSGPSVVQDRIADLLIAQWDEAGFNVTRDMLLQDDHIIQVAIGAYNVVTWRQFGAAEASVDNVWLLCRTIGGISLNWPRYCDEDRDAALLAAQATTDPAERAALYQEAEQLINDAAVYVFFNHTRWSNALAEGVNNACAVSSPEGVMTRCVVNGAGRYEAIWMD